MNPQTATARAERTQPVHIGDHLREWRQRRHLSQLDLAGDAEISARHLSFVETGRDRKSTRLNSSHSQISYAVFCLKKKKNQLVISVSQRDRNYDLIQHSFADVPPLIATRSSSLRPCLPRR